MLTIPLYSFLILYFIFLIIFFIFSLINVAHITSTGSLTLASFLVTFIVGALCALIFYGAWYFLQGVYWQTPITIWNTDWISSILPFNSF